MFKVCHFSVKKTNYFNFCKGYSQTTLIYFWPILNPSPLNDTFEEVFFHFWKMFPTGVRLVYIYVLRDIKKKPISLYFYRDCTYR